MCGGVLLVRSGDDDLADIMESGAGRYYTLRHLVVAFSELSGLRVLDQILGEVVLLVGEVDVVDYLAFFLNVLSSNL